MKRVKLRKSKEDIPAEIRIKQLEEQLEDCYEKIQELCNERRALEQKMTELSNVRYYTSTGGTSGTTYWPTDATTSY